jgi:hypothetical protein
VLYHRKRTKCGGNNWLYVRVGEGRDVKRYLVLGRYVPTIDWDNVTEEQLDALNMMDSATHSPLALLLRVTGKG